MEVNVNYTTTYCAKIVCMSVLYDEVGYTISTRIDTPCCQSSTSIIAQEVLLKMSFWTSFFHHTGAKVILGANGAWTDT